MARRDQPYLPLYVQDVISDEKLIECSAESHGVYFRLLCLMHKSDDYGKILLKQKYKQTGSICGDFALMLTRYLPFKTDIIERSVTELVDEGVLIVDGDYLIQKRMVRDDHLSTIRSKSGRKGASSRQQAKKPDPFFAKANYQANSKANDQANTEIEIENEIENEIDFKKGGPGEKTAIDGAKLLADITAVVGHLNARAGTNFNPEVHMTRWHIESRFNEGHTVDDLKAIIDFKCDEWLGTEFARNLNPSVLFTQDGCEKYLNQIQIQKHGKHSQRTQRSGRKEKIFDLP